MLPWTSVSGHFLVDGSLRDIVIDATRADDWTAMLRWLPTSNFAYRFSRRWWDDQPLPAALPPVAGDELWSFNREDDPMLVVDVPGTPVCHFVHPGEIEFHFDPKAVHDQQTCDALFAFVRELGRAVNKPVNITPESFWHSVVLIRFDPVSDRFQQGASTLADL